jgi:hypothetical protein
MILLATPRLKSYLEHGLIVTKIYEAKEYLPVSYFKTFGDTESQTRRHGISDPIFFNLSGDCKVIG